MAIDPNLQSLLLQLKAVTDRVRGVANGGATGFYLCGRPGTSKTFTVCKMLNELGIQFIYHSGRLTAIGLFALIKENPHSIIVVDDVSTIFREQIAMELLLAALGNNGGARTVRYKTARIDEAVEFTGGVIMISNLEFESHDSQLLDALNDRIYVIRYKPTDEQIISLMRHIASQGIEGVPPGKCQAVLEFLLQESLARNIRPSMRLFVDKAMKDYLLHTRGQSELDWRDLIVSNLEQQVIQPAHSVTDLRRADQIAAERRIASEICVRHTAPKERIQAWEEQTGKSAKSFYRRCRELKAASANPCYVTRELGPDGQ